MTHTDYYYHSMSIISYKARLLRFTVCSVLIFTRHGCSSLSDNKLPDAGVSHFLKSIFWEIYLSYFHSIKFNDEHFGQVAKLVG